MTRQRSAVVVEHVLRAQQQWYIRCRLVDQEDLHKLYGDGNPNVKIIVAHSLHSAKSGDEELMDEFYGGLKRCIEDAGTRGHLLVLGDCDACVGSVCSPPLAVSVPKMKLAEGNDSESCSTCVVLLL